MDDLDYLMLKQQRDELLSALKSLYDQAEGFNVSFVYFNEFAENKEVLRNAENVIAKVEASK